MTEGQTNYIRYLLQVFKTGSRILEAKLTSKSLRKRSNECTKDTWPPVEQTTSRMGARAKSGSINMAVIEEIESSTLSSYLSPTARMFGCKQTTSGFHFRLLKPEVVFRRQT